MTTLLALLAGPLYAGKQSVRGCAALLVHRLNLLGLRLEAWVGRRFPGKRKLRVLASACWHFPIYSQTFVYRELSELAQGDFDLRFAYSGLCSRNQLADEFSCLWRRKRRLILSEFTCARDLEYYRRRMPQRVEDLTRLIADAAGLPPDEILANEHFRQAFSFARMAECWQPDYIHTYFFYERTLFALVASYLLGIPRGVSCYADHMLQDYPLKLVPLQLRTCAVVVATSARIRQELETLAGRPLPKVVVKPNAIDIRQFARERQSAGRRDTWQIVCVSRIHPKKGLTYLIDAVLRLRQQGAPAVLRILGEPDSHDPESLAYHRALAQRIAEDRIATTVLLEGRKTSREVRECLEAADLFVAPFVELPNGDKDGIPTALLEAMAAGCPIVCTDAGSITEVVSDGLEGIIVPQADAGALAQSMLRLLQDETLRDRMSRAARDRARRDFDIGLCETLFHQRVHAAIAAADISATREIPAS